MWRRTILSVTFMVGMSVAAAVAATAGPVAVSVVDIKAPVSQPRGEGTECTNPAECALHGSTIPVKSGQGR